MVLNLKGLQFLLGLEPPEGTLDDNVCIQLPQKTSPSHPSPGILQAASGFVLLEDLVVVSAHKHGLHEGLDDDCSPADHVVGLVGL